MWLLVGLLAASATACDSSSACGIASYCSSDLNCYPVGECLIYNDSLENDCPICPSSKECGAGYYCAGFDLHCHPFSECITYNDALESQCPPCPSSQACGENLYCSNMDLACHPITECVIFEDAIETQCPPCRSSQDCGDNFYCSNVDFICHPVSECAIFGDAIETKCPPCRSSQECGENSYCSNVDFACYPNTDCPIYQDAIEGQCPAPPCFSSAFCQSDEYCSKGGKCRATSDCQAHKDAIEGFCPGSCTFLNLVEIESKASTADFYQQFDCWFEFFQGLGTSQSNSQDATLNRVQKFNVTIGSIKWFAGDAEEATLSQDWDGIRFLPDGRAILTFLSERTNDGDVEFQPNCEFDSSEYPCLQVAFPTITRTYIIRIVDRDTLVAWALRSDDFSIIEFDVLSRTSNVPPPGFWSVYADNAVPLECSGGQQPGDQVALSCCNNGVLPTPENGSADNYFDIASVGTCNAGTDGFADGISCRDNQLSLDQACLVGACTNCQSTLTAPADTCIFVDIGLFFFAIPDNECTPLF